MRLEFVKAFVNSTTEILGDLLGSEVAVRSMAMQANPSADREVITIIGLMGEVQGDVIIDLDQETAEQLGGFLTGEVAHGMTPLMKSSIAEMASMAIGRAISQINDNGTRLTMTPPNIFTESHLRHHDKQFETLVAPITTAYGEVRISVAIQDLN
ncbi:MAG: chemotaxis protein CheX [Acidobacteria bacterium]|nr:chemotaxis protein CheX [Acidobacteriota bacterium]